MLVKKVVKEMGFNRNKLYCVKMIRQDDELHTILCEDDGKQCVCTSCIDDKEGYIVNSWIRECPGFKEKLLGDLRRELRGTYVN